MRDAPRRFLILPGLVLVTAAACGTSEAGDVTRLSDAQTGASPPLPGAYTLFEADPVRPVAVLEESGWVAVANTADDSLQFFEPTPSSLRARGALKVGLRPVAVAVVQESASRAQLWVVNHLSDSVSVVDLDLDTGRADVIDTLYVGDEPRDIVVASDSAGQRRVFVATAHRGQHHPRASARLATDLVTPPAEKQDRGLADVQIFDPAARAAPPSVVNLFSDKPRALAVADGVVYAASFLSGNRTTAIPARTVTARGLLSLAAVLASDAQGKPIEQGDELLLAPGMAGQATIEGGQPAVAGQGRCLAHPGDADDDFPLQRLCVETDAQQRVQRVLVQRKGALTPSCQCTSGDGTLQPTTGVIVQFFDSAAACGEAFTTFPDGSQGCWLDAAPGGVRSPASAAARQSPPMAWNQQLKFSLPDQDVFAIGVDDLELREAFSGVGTILFGLAVQPRTGKLFVTNTDAHNLTRFEGHGQSSSTSVIGHLHESRITVIDPQHAPDMPLVQPVHLNTHIDYGRCCDKDPEENQKSFAFPTAAAFSADGERLFFSALGSDKVGIVKAAALRAGFDQDQARAQGELREIFLGDDVSQPSGPVGLALDAHRDRLYVKTLFDNQLVVIDAGQERITGRVSLPSPEPESITRGRSILYNARLTSAHGDSACASCHIFGDLDGLSWDLGNPDTETVRNPGPFALGTEIDADFRSNKGPMSTQTLRGLANHGPLHWRGDRTRHFQDQPGEQPDQGSLDEFNSFTEFDVAITGLNGNDQPLDPEVFREFADFALQLTLPPNPIRSLDDSLTPDQAAARALYFGCSSLSDEQLAARTCNGTDGELVEIDAATHDCVCARNGLVDTLHDLPAVQAFTELFRGALANEALRSRLEALASDVSALPPDRQAPIAQAAASFSRGVAELLVADATPAEQGLLSEDLAGALSSSSQGLLEVLDASAVNDTSIRDEIAALLLAVIPMGALPPEISRDANGLVQVFETVAEVAAISELAREDEAARGTGGFRNLLNGCDWTAESACNLRVTDGAHTCQGCHRLDPKGNAEFGVAHPGFFGTDGEYSFEGESQVFKIPQLRNAYQKTGMFGAPPDPFFLQESVLGPRSGGWFSPDTVYTGPQVRGFGFFHDGVADTLQRFHGARAFVRGEGNADALDPFLPRAEKQPACIQRFRHAPISVLGSAPERLRPVLGLCVESGPLPESCFGDPGAEECRSVLAAAEQALALPGLADGFANGVLPVCFQLGSMLEGGSAQGDCYPSGLVERAQLESFMLAFDTNLKPMVGQQLTLAEGSYDDPRLVPLLAAASRGDCDLSLQQRADGFVLTRPIAGDPGSSLLLDATGKTLPLWQIAGHTGELTWTCQPPAPERAEARRAAFSRAAR
jgi:DNA-binding beta-propeller fold protein YncE